MLDHSIANHFPHFEIPTWNLLHPEISPPIPPPSPSEDGTEDFTTGPQKHPNPVLEEFFSPSPEAVPGLPSLTSMGLEENSLENSVLEVPGSPSKPDEIPTELEDLPGHQPQDWQTVPSSEIENTSLPPVLEPKKTPRQPKVKRGKGSDSESPPRESRKTPRQPKAKRGKRSDSESPLRDPSVKKNRRR